jgi:hypothetical protein
VSSRGKTDKRGGEGDNLSGRRRSLLKEAVLATSHWQVLGYHALEMRHERNDDNCRRDSGISEVKKRDCKNTSVWS